MRLHRAQEQRDGGEQVPAREPPERDVPDELHDQPDDEQRQQAERGDDHDRRDRGDRRRLQLAGAEAAGHATTIGSRRSTGCRPRARCSPAPAAAIDTAAMESQLPPVLAGAEAWSHSAPDTPDGPPAGFLALHGFTGNPSSMRGFAEAAAGAGLPRRAPPPARPRHDRRGHADHRLGGLARRGGGGVRPPDGADRPRRRRRAQHGRRAGAGGRRSPTPRSSGWCASTRPPGPQPDEVRAMLADFLADGTTLVPGIGSDIADPDAVEIAYDGTPVASAAVVHGRRPGPDGGSLRRADDAAAAVDVAPGPRRRAQPERAPGRARTAGRSTTAGSSAATTWRRRTSTAT